ncbi:hypothetical protein T484DRAFT_2961000 [Baffinella frigidus]|nr:hypothetical protein T484DRAFT_2961000 [Cryptophyta sp. CCMP2293]
MSLRYCLRYCLPYVHRIVWITDGLFTIHSRVIQSCHVPGVHPLGSGHVPDLCHVLCRVHEPVHFRLLRVWGLGFEAWGVGFGVWCLVFGVWCLEFGVWDLWLRVSFFGRTPLPAQGSQQTCHHASTSCPPRQRARNIHFFTSFRGHPLNT